MAKWKGQALSLNITYYVTFWNLINVFHAWSDAFGGLMLSSPLEDLVYRRCWIPYIMHTPYSLEVAGSITVWNPKLISYMVKIRCLLCTSLLLIAIFLLWLWDRTSYAIRQNIGLKFSHSLIAVLVLTGGRAFDDVLLSIYNSACRTRLAPSIMMCSWSNYGKIQC